MSDNVISYIEMCSREGANLQAEMNYGLGGNHSGSFTQNGKFNEAAQSFKSGSRDPERVRVYEKVRTGIWSCNGVFHLVDSWRERGEFREVFKFRLVAVEGDEDFSAPPQRNIQRRRVIPTAVKLAVWARDGGKCTKCGATDELHFDHDLPWSKGGTSITEKTCNCFVLDII